jgi:simple sugar transport system permease protein
MVNLLSVQHSFIADTFPVGFGFTGIAVALLGRNNPLGIAFASYLFAFLETTVAALQLSFNPSLKVPNEMALVMQGAILLAVVISYELVRRAELVATARAVARTGAAA